MMVNKVLNEGGAAKEKSEDIDLVTPNKQPSSYH